MDRKHERKDGLTVVDKSSLAREMIETAVVVVETAILVNTHGKLKAKINPGRYRN